MPRLLLSLPLLSLRASLLHNTSGARDVMMCLANGSLYYMSFLSQTYDLVMYRSVFYGFIVIPSRGDVAGQRIFSTALSSKTEGLLLEFMGQFLMNIVKQ